MALTRNSKTVLSKLVENNSGQILTTVPCKIQVPERYDKIGLGEIGTNTLVYGCLAIILETGEYAVLNINAIVELNPFKTVTIDIDGVPYYEFTFEANSVVFNTTSIVKRNNIMYNIINEFIFLGKVPWFMEYEDLGKLFDTANYHGGSNIAQNLEIIEFIASLVTRPYNDRSKYLRTVINSYEETALDKIAYVPLKSVIYSVNSTIHKLAGSNFSEGVVSALVNQTTRVESIEKIVRV